MQIGGEEEDPHLPLASRAGPSSPARAGEGAKGRRSRFSHPLPPSRERVGRGSSSSYYVPVPLYPILLAVLGAILGSFIATLVLRWPAGRSLGGRSACDGCGRRLGPLELIPLASAAALRGRCRTCRVPIAPMHYGVEAAAAAIGALSGWLSPDAAGVAGAVFGWLLLTLALLDLKAWWLPDVLTGALAASGVAAGALGLGPPLLDRAIGGVAGFVLLWGVGFGYRTVRGREGMGGGDPKLFGGIGLWLGWAMLPPVLLVGCLLGLGVAVAARIGGRIVARDDALPLGALLAAAAYPAWALMIGLAP